MTDLYWVALSALQHWQLCPRQAVLIYRDDLWIENRLTAEGRDLHLHVDDPGMEKRKDVRYVRALRLSSSQYGIQGQADMVEFQGPRHKARPYPIEYKRGRPKKHLADQIQLCAQALCLEDMFGYDIPEAALYYHQTRRRQVVPLDQALRERTIEVIEACRAGILSNALPAPIYEAKKCDACSLYQICLPRHYQKKQDYHQWLHAQIHDSPA